MKKRILLLTPYFPYPPIHGGAVRISNLMKHLSKKYDIYLLSFVKNEEEALFSFDLKKRTGCKDIFPVLLQAHPSSSSHIDTPWEDRYFSHEMVDILKDIIKTYKIDLVQIDFIVMANYANHISGIPVIFTEHDTSNLTFEKSIHYRELNDTDRRRDWERLISYEHKICRKFNKIIVLTPEDKQQLQDFLKYKTDIRVIQTGVDIKYFKSQNAPSVKYPTITYLGHYLHYPNHDAILYFYKEMFPAISKQVPGVKLHIVGSGPTKEILELQSDPRVTVTGEVPDVREYLRKSTVFIAPLRVGGGIKGKILEAMAMKVPVVANKLGASGIPAVDGKEILIAQTTEDFTAKTVLLLKDSNLRKNIAGNARKFVEKNYDWNLISKTLSKLYDETLNTPQGLS
ncbi:MAG: hypothetical protein A3J83_03840 [Elusimicrobia bacterium RIFOXYA2_FULL_40_6]|nr:MAG: hypothetical protein A3J83_03840 [Elusimicrobia bacterium RIFOXYA2_FULL_40_6]